MRPVIYNDVLAAVAVAAAAPPDQHGPIIASLIREADLAEVYRRRYQSAHPVFGDGSLMTAALRHQTRGPTSFQCAEGLAAWIAVLKALQALLPLSEVDFSLDEPNQSRTRLRLLTHSAR